MRTKYSKFYQDVNSDLLNPLKRGIGALTKRFGIATFEPDTIDYPEDEPYMEYTSKGGTPYFIPKSQNNTGLGTAIATLDKLKRNLINSGSSPSHLSSVPTAVVPWGGSAYGSNALNGKEVFMMDPNDSVVNTHEIGHFLDFTRNSGKQLRSSLAKALLPGLGDMRTLWDERQANKKSWKALKKTYKNNPELLAKFKQLRSEALPKAYATYLTLSGLRGASTLGGGAAAAYYANKKNRQDEEELNELINSEEFKSLSKKEQRKILRSAKWRNKNRSWLEKRMRELGYGVAGSAAGNVAGTLAAIPANMAAGKRLFSYMNSEDRKKGLAELNKLIQEHDPNKIYAASSKPSGSTAHGISSILPNILASIGGYSDDIEDKPKTSILDSLKGYWNNRKNNTGSNNKKNK